MMRFHAPTQIDRRLTLPAVARFQRAGAGLVHHALGQWRRPGGLAKDSLESCISGTADARPIHVRKPLIELQDGREGMDVIGVQQRFAPLMSERQTLMAATGAAMSTPEH